MKLNLSSLAAVFAGLLLCTSLFGQAQITTRKERLSDFTSKTTKVVLTGDAMLDQALKENIASSWTASPYEFCSTEDFEKLKSNTSYYFLMVVKGQFRKESEPGIDMLTLVKGGEGASISDMFEVVTFPLRATDEPSGREIDILPAILKIMQDNVLSQTQSEFKAYTGITCSPKDMQKLGTKQIFFCKDDMAPQVGADILKTLDEDIFIEPDSDDVDDVFNKGQYNAAVSYVVAPSSPVTGSYCYTMLIGADTHELYFFKKHRVTAHAGVGFLPIDLKAIKLLRK